MGTRLGKDRFVHPVICRRVMLGSLFSAVPDGSVRPKRCHTVNMSTGVVSVRLPDDLKGRLDALSASTGRPAAFYLREALAEHLDDMEHAYGVLGRAEAIRAGSRDTVPFADVMTELEITRSKLDGLSSEPGE